MPDKRGRPPLDDEDPSVSVTLRLPSKHFDHVCTEAQRARLTVPSSCAASCGRRSRN